MLSHPRIYADAGEGPSEELPADLMMGNCCTHRKTDAMTRRPAAETRAPSAIDLSQNAKASPGPPGFKRAPSLTTGLARVPSLTRASRTCTTPRSHGSFSAPKSGEAPKSANEKKTQAKDVPKTKRQSSQKRESKEPVLKPKNKNVESGLHPVPAASHDDAILHYAHTRAKWEFDIENFV